MIDQIRQRENSSVRRSCRVLGLRRQTYHHRKRGHRSEERDQVIVDLLHQLTRRFVAWGFWMVFYFLRNQGHQWNHKRVYRLWKQEQLHLRLPPKRARIRRQYQKLLAPDGVNEGWAMDFVSDWIVGPEQKPVRIINLMDEGSRKALWTEVHHRISAKTLIEVLDQVVAWRGKPQYIRLDNGPEFIAHRLQKWAEDLQVELKYIQPGKPSQNGLIERLNKTLRVECLNLTWFDSLEQLNEELQSWWQVYNSERPHRNIGYRTPDQYEADNQNFFFSAVAV